MSLTNFSIYPPSTVILDDERNPDVSWANHQRRAGASRGGVDTVAPIGTPIYAWADGFVHNVPNDGSAGNVIRLQLANNSGWYLDYKHLSQFAVTNGKWVPKGALIGYSGDSGGVSPHLHLNLVDPNGVRQNPWHFVSPSGGASASTGTSPLTESLGLQLPKVISVSNGTIALVDEFSSTVYPNFSQGNAFSIGANTKAYGSVSNLTEDEVATLVREAQNRRAGLIEDISRAAKKS